MSENLDALAEVVGSVLLRGKKYDVLPIDGAGYRMLHANGDIVLDTFGLAGRLLSPALSDEDAHKLTAKQAARIIQIADGQVRAVEDSFPNSESPTTQTSQSGQGS